MSASRQAPHAGAGPFVSPESITLRAISASLCKLVENQQQLLDYLAMVAPAIEDLTDAVEDLPQKLSPRPRRPRKGEAS